jgi:DNA-nicking Smr family endonuclease
MLKDDEIELFKQTVKNAAPLKTSERHPLFEKKIPPIIRYKKQAAVDPYEVLHSSYFEGHPKDHWVDGDAPLHFAKNGISAQYLRKLQRGSSIISHWVDLHRLTVKEALVTTHQFIQRCHQEEVRHMGLIHGKGYRTAMKQPILKNVLNDWLRTHPAVLAFLSAKNRDGGTGALYVLLKKTD